MIEATRDVGAADLRSAACAFAGRRCHALPCAAGGRGEGRCRVNSQERLAAFDQFAEDIRHELDEVSRRMEQLRAENKVKSATYKQLFAIRSTLKEIDRRLAKRGL